MIVGLAGFRCRPAVTIREDGSTYTRSFTNGIIKPNGGGRTISITGSLERRGLAVVRRLSDEGPNLRAVRGRRSRRPTHARIRYLPLPVPSRETLRYRRAWPRTRPSRDPDLSPESRGYGIQAERT